MKTSKTIDFIVRWIKNYKEVNAVNGFVVGVSGGIDSALTSTLCAMTGIQYIMPKYAYKTKRRTVQ